jgi:hypothetical protein
MVNEDFFYSLKPTWLPVLARSAESEALVTLSAVYQLVHGKNDFSKS